MATHNSTISRQLEGIPEVPLEEVVRSFLLYRKGDLSKYKPVVDFVFKFAYRHYNGTPEFVDNVALRILEFLSMWTPLGNTREELLENFQRYVLKAMQQGKREVSYANDMLNSYEFFAFMVMNDMESDNGKKVNTNQHLRDYAHETYNRT